MTWKPVVVVLASCGLVAACSSAAPTTAGASGSVSADTRAVASPAAASPSVTGPLSLDAGALVIEPLAGPTPTVTHLQAARVLAGSFEGEGPRTPVVAHVRVHVPSVRYAPRGAVTQLDLADAWVYLVPQPSTSGSCTVTTSGGHWGPSPTPTPVPATASGTYAVIVDGTTGRGYVYAGAGTGACGPSSSPTLDAIQLEVSVGYQVHRATPRSARLTVALPPCARFESFTPSFVVAGQRRGMATARVAAGPCSGRGATLVQGIPGRFVESPHSAVGLVCSGAYDAELGRPDDCVTY